MLYVEILMIVILSVYFVFLFSVVTKLIEWFGNYNNLLAQKTRTNPYLRKNIVGYPWNKTCVLMHQKKKKNDLMIW